MQSKLEIEQKTNAVETPLLKSRNLVTTPKITITKQTILTPIQKTQLHQQQQQHKPQQQQQHAQLQLQKQKQLYATLTAKQTTTAGNVTTTKSLSKVVFTSKDFKGIIKPLSKSNLTPSSSAKVDGGTGGAIAAATPPNVAIVAAKRPHLTIVPSKALNVLDNSAPASLVSSTALSPATTTTTTTTLANSTTATADTSTESSKMEHSYIKDTTSKVCNMDVSNGLTPARTILVRKPPQCPSCHTHPLEEQDLSDANQAPIPSYNEIMAKEAMNECARIAKYVKNTNDDDDDWESKINQNGWSNMQKNLFTKVALILDDDQLGRLANCTRSNEAMQRRVVVDKSSARMRKALASVAWESRLTQWLHCLLMDCLPSTYMASYLDILQTLKSKLPTLMDKMLFGRPLNVSQELLAPVMKRKWEPIIPSKVRKLAQNSVIVALPSMPTSGPVPNRLQKWYQHLASITQIVQVTLPMTSGHISRQPLEQVAEQIVSLTRVKIQELKSENSQRSIILMGFNAGASLALQVAMSETVACVICMGFAYNTYNGVRGTPDDRILEIKVPILFVVGQNSARSSPEEIESLREKMQSESSLVVVGSADDVLRVPKSRRKIENVTQSMVDTMVVDEVYDFIRRILMNPPGPRPASAIATHYAKQQKLMIGGTDKASGLQRKRKQDGSGEQDVTPAKTKTIVGRPRIRPLSNTAPGKVTSSVILNKDDSETLLNSSTGSTDSQKAVSSFDLVSQSKTTPTKTHATLMNSQQKQIIISSGAGSATTTSPAIGTKIKMIPSNQFVQLKPTSLQSQSKIYTIKTTSMVGGQNVAVEGSSSNSSTLQGPRIGSIVTTTPNSSTTGQHIFTLKTPSGQTTQFATAAGAQKFTTLQLAAGGTKLLPVSQAPSTSAGIAGGTTASGLDIANIIDMPILFADNDGNISDVSNQSSSVSGAGMVGSTSGANIKQGSSNVGQLIISQKIIKEANSPVTTPSTTPRSTFVINKPGTIIQTAQQLSSSTSTNTTSLNKPNKVVFINRNAMKPCPNIISRASLTQQLPKYTKVMVTNAKAGGVAGGMSTTIVPRTGTQISASTAVTPMTSTVKQINLQALNSATARSSAAGGILNVQTKNLPQIQIINNPNASLISTDKPQIRNIVVKPGGLKQLPPHLTTQLLNRNLTVRKLVNLVPATKTTTTGNVTITSAAIQKPAIDIQEITEISPAASSQGTTMQTSPKIITINPGSRNTTAKSD